MPHGHIYSSAVCGLEAFQNGRKEDLAQATLLAMISHSSSQFRKKHFWFLIGYEGKTHSLLLLWLAFLNDLRILVLKESGMICVIRDKLCEQLCDRREI